MDVGIILGFPGALIVDLSEFPQGFRRELPEINKPIGKSAERDTRCPHSTVVISFF